MKKRVTPDDTTAAEGKTIPRLYLREVSPTDDDGPYEGIGADLRAARVETGVDIAAVADNTRISRGYLEAIEDGRFNDLPGGAYVYGFLRSYAEYLDLDPKSVIAKYKSESEHPRAETKLAFPSPMDQGRLPTGRLLASSLVLAGLVYAGWYVVSGGQQQSAEVVSPVPERFAAILDNSASSDTTGQGLPGTQSVLGVAAPVQDVEIAPVGPPEEALIAGATQTQIPAPPAPAPQVASTGEASAADSTNEPALPLRRQGEQQVAALAPE
ncbi:MAG: helix-turn-helix domain-containing protein, partial [Proteobacteria bacterium]|nr:helix-turn-helix domain-containing protein [Pseudomonadota bacterium]